ncbi:MAG: fimbrillin family protein [Candidatus Cryptobacteroides sp.]
MRKRVLTYLTLIMAVSCSKNELQDWLPKSLVAYNVVAEPVSQTKAASAFPTTSSFMSSAYELDSSQSWDADYASSSLKFGPEEVKYIDTYWSTETRHFWEDGKKLTFFSYSPVSLQAQGLTITREGVSVSGWDITQPGMSDQLILVADIAKDKVKNESFAGFTGVPTHFRQKLSKITFRIAESDISDADEIYITRLAVGGYYTKGDYQKGGTPAEAWTNLSNPADEYVFYEDVDGRKLTDDFWSIDKVMIPQSIRSEAYLSITYKTVKGTVVNTEGPVILSFVKDFRSGIWSMGSHITYSLKVGAGMFPILFDASAGDWKYNEGGVIEIE